MNKSLLELLEEEKKEVLNIRFYRSSINDLRNQAENEVETSCKEACYRIASKYEEKAEESGVKLTEIRKELKQYLSFLMEF